MPPRRTKSKRGRHAVPLSSQSTEEVNNSEESGHGDGHVDLVSLLQENGSEEGGSDIVVEHLASDLPVGLGFSTSDRDIDDAMEGGQPTTFREQLKNDDAAVIAQLRRELIASHSPSERSQPQKTKKGKLKRPTRSLGRRLEPQKVLSQRPFKGPAQHDRPDTYDLPGSPPEIGIPAKARIDGAAEMSPLRKQKKVKQTPGQQTNGDRSPGLSRAQMASFEDAPVVVSPRRKPRRGSQKGASPHSTSAKKLRRSQSQHDSRDYPEADHGPFFEDDNEDESRQSTSAAVTDTSPRRSQRIQSRESVDVSSDDEVADHEQESEHGPENAKHFPEAQVIIPKIIRIRNSEIFPRDAPGSLNGADDTQISLPKESAPQKQKKGAGPSGQRQVKKIKQGDGPMGKRRRNVEEPIEHDLFVGTDETSGGSDHLNGADEGSNLEGGLSLSNDLLGQRKTLRELRDIALEIDANRETPLDNLDDDITMILSELQQAQNTLTELEKDPTKHGLSDPFEELEDIRRRVLRLCGKDKSHPTDFDDRIKSEAIYRYLIPRMICFATDAAERYSVIDESKARSDCSITVEHLGLLTRLINNIGEIGEAAKHLYKRPHARSVSVSRVHNGLIVPLRAVQKRFSEYIRKHKASQARADAEAQRQAREAEQARIEEIEAQRKAQTAKLAKKWRTLHDERRFVEPHILKRDKQQHLRLVEHATELDSNGDPFERENFFRPRIGPPPAHVEAARSQFDRWGNHEVEALLGGLERFADDGDIETSMVFERIFRQYCVRSGPLNKFSVTEIVTFAADAKNWLKTQQMEEQGRIEDWVKAIPVWTSPRELHGQENEGGQVNSG